MEKHLSRAYELIGKHLPYSKDELLVYYQNSNRFRLDLGKYSFFLFSIPVFDDHLKRINRLSNQPIGLENIIILVFDEDMKVVGDLSAIHTSLKDYLTSDVVYDYLCDESDWSYLSNYVLSSFYYPDLSYPIRGKDAKRDFSGEVLAIVNAYVTKAYRKQRIFSWMLEMLEDYLEGNTTIYEVISLDPDIACYGEDKKNEPYFYSFSLDEPIRMQNREIIKKLGFIPLMIDDFSNDNIDGTKIHFAVKKMIVYDI